MNEEQQLRREIEELKRQLRLQSPQAPAGLPAERWKPSGITISVLLFAFLVLAAGAFVAGYSPMQKREAEVRAEAEARENAVPRMEVMPVTRGDGANELKLPGTMQAVAEAPILARADGYLKRRLADIGDRVTAGQVLAEIDAPELDQQIRQAEAAVEQAQAALEQAQASLEQGKANRDLARITAERWQAMSAQGIIPQQDLDQRQAQLTAQNANVQALDKAISAQRSTVAASKANLARLQEIQGYRSVKAPFDGTITLRNVDAGALVSAGNTLLFRIAQTGALRTYVNVPQASANSVKLGQPAVLTVSNFPGRQFRGTVARTANALDPTSRTMLVEINVPNGEGALLPGSYTEVQLNPTRLNPPVVVPASAIIFRTDGAQVAVVEADNTIRLQKIAAGRDFGDRVEVLQGLSEGMTIVAVPGDAARDGAKIVPVSLQSQESVK